MSDPVDEDAARRPRWRTLGRREMLGLGFSSAVAGSVGLALGFYGGVRHERDKRSVPPREQAFSPSVFLAIDADGVTTVWVTKSEMGQGVLTSLPMIVADELEADWSNVRAEQAPASRRFGNQSTTSSSSVSSMWRTLREAGAIAREMLRSAAAQSWGVSRGECRAESGMVVHEPTGRQLSYGALAPIAATLEVPRSAALHPRAERARIGVPTRRLDTPSKVDGTAVYGLDVRRPGMLFATVARCPEIGGRLESFDAASALRVDGVDDVVEIEDGVAVIARSTWHAFRGRDALAVRWAPGSNADLSTSSIRRALREGVGEGGAVARADGDVRRALASAARTLEADYEVPYLAHACMEPINCTAWSHDGRVEVWAPTQKPQAVRETAADVTGASLSDCHVYVTFLGGGFGRRVQQEEVRQAVQLSRHTCPRPVQVTWSREDCTRHDFYRHATLHRFAVGLDAAGRPTAWSDRIASPSLLHRSAARGEVDEVAVDGAANVPYAIDNVRVTWRDVSLPLRLGIWRSVGHSYNAFAVESMIDEVAAASGADPVQLRMSLLEDHPAERAVLQRAAEMAGWGGAVPEGRARGVAVHACFGSFGAQVAEVSVTRGRPRVHRVWAAVQCGQVVNPDTVEAQIQGGIAFGLSAALYGRIRVENGSIVESNFHDYRIVRIDEMPEVEVAILPLDRSPGGVGELGVPHIAPAVCNALFALTGRRCRRLPIELG